MDNNSYHPEPYWSDVAERIDSREERNVIAGDDEPYYRYKRDRFLRLLKNTDFNDKNVMELGAGPGGNIAFILQNFSPKSFTDADISAKMLELAAKNVKNSKVKFVKTDGQNLPFEKGAFDISFAATVLQHNTDEKMLLKIIAEMCRVTHDKVVIFEKIEPTITGDELCLGRPVTYYAKAFETHGFQLVETEFINVKISYYVSGGIRKLLNPPSRKEGEPLSKIAVFMQNMTLVVTKQLDKVFTSRRNIGKLVFQKI
jgi:ubiquinone/menaquinone biosynthesis C-methylase UbiE